MALVGQCFKDAVFGNLGPAFYGAFHVMGDPQNAWFVENILLKILKWMMTGATPISGNLHMLHDKILVTTVAMCVNKMLLMYVTKSVFLSCFAASCSSTTIHSTNRVVGFATPTTPSGNLA